MSDLPPGWVSVYVDDIKANSPNALAIGPFGSNLKVSDYREAGVPLVFVRNIRARAFAIGDLKFVSTAKAESLRSHHVRQSDLLVTKMGDPPGDGAIYPLADEGIITADCIKLTPHPSVNVRYLLHALGTPAVKRQIIQITQGVAQPKMSLARFRHGVQLPLAPSAEQVRIVAAIEEQFSRLDAGVAVLERARQNIKRMRAAIFESAVTEWIGEGFPQIRLGDVLREPLRNGHSAKADPLGTIPILALTAVTLGDFGTHNVKMTAADPRRVRDLWIQPGDLLIERSNTRELVGTACLYRGRPNLAVYPDLVIRARVDGRVVPEYAELVLKAPRSRRYFQQRAQGISGTMPKIDQHAIEDLVFTLPSPEMQAAIVQEAERRLTLLGSLQEALELVAKRSSTLRSSILTASFSGQLTPQDPKDEPASVLLERIAAERTASNGHKPTRTRKPRALGERITA